MGTQATACLYQALHDLQNVSVEQEYFDVLLYSKPSIPDRTAYITGKSTENPLESLINAALILENAEVDCIAIPCATSHFFYDELTKAVSIPILDLLDETARYAKAIGAKKVCLLATDGTIKSRLFHDALERYGIEAATPPDNVQADLMEIIYDIKRGEVFSSDILNAIISKVCDDGVDAVILGCTELCVLKTKDRGQVHQSCLNHPQSADGTLFSKRTNHIVNILEVLAEASIAFCKTGKDENSIF